VAIRRIFLAAHDHDPVLATTLKEATDSSLKARGCRETVVLNTAILVVHPGAGWPSTQFIAHGYVADPVTS